MPNTKTTTFINITSALLIFLFVYTGINKLLGQHSFIATISKSPLIGDAAIFVSWAVPISELIIAFLLFFIPMRKLGLFLSFLLMSIFTFYICYMLFFTPNLPCSCGGVLRQLNWQDHLLLNIIFTLLALAGWIISKKNKRVIAIIRMSRTPV